MNKLENYFVSLQLISLLPPKIFRPRWDPSPVLREVISVFVGPFDDSRKHICVIVLVP